MKKTKRFLSVLVLICIMLSCIPVETAAAAAKYSKQANYRITVDGTVYRTTAYKDKKGEVYVTTAAAKKLLGETAKKTVKINGKRYANLKTYANQCNVVSYEYDPALNSSYIWTYSLSSDISSRVKYYKLGTPSSSTITYKQFFSILNKTVAIAAPDRLKEWKKLYPEARSATRKMTRAEGFMAMFYMATFLGKEYTEFNFEWFFINDAIGSGSFDELDSISKKINVFEYLKNDYPYNLGGFEGAPYICEWDIFSVALRYAYGRISEYDNKPLFDYDAVNASVHVDEYMTYADALHAAARLLDSNYVRLAEKKAEKLVKTTNKLAVNYDKEIITAAHLEYVKTLPEINNGDLSDWNGFVWYTDYGQTELDYISFAEFARHCSEWGFSTIRYMICYETFFNEKATKVDVNQLKDLDRIIAIAMECKLHLNLVTITVPGRVTKVNQTDFTSEGDFDLFVSKTHQTEAKRVWGTLASRYRNIPASALSFSPLWESQNANLSTGLSAPQYTPEQVGAVYKQLETEIHKYGAERVVVYEATSNCEESNVLTDVPPVKKAMADATGNVQVISNFSQAPYVYANMTATVGDNIDHNNHSMFLETYPTVDYGTQSSYSYGESMILNGDLWQGTTISLYLEHISEAGTFQVIGDGEVLYSENLTQADYKLGYRLSRYYPYATSDKRIEVKLEKDYDKIEIKFSGSYWRWCGMDVTLPETAAVERWYNASKYDLYLQGKDNITAEDIRPRKVSTSNILISPRGEEGNVITINSDVTFKTDTIWKEANAQTIDSWGKTVSGIAPNSVVRCECAAFSIGTDKDSVLAYYKDFLDMCKKYNLGFLMNESLSVIGGFEEFPSYNYGGMTAVASYGGKYVQVDLIKLFQKYAQVSKKI